MAHPSSSHRDRDDDRATTRDRTHRSTSHHHHRTISSTTLLLVLSLILAVLAVMLSLPSRSSGVLPSTSSAAARQQQQVPDTGSADQDAGASHSFWGYLTPKRSHALVSRESAVALREAEVARREAELLAGLPGGFPYAPCPVCGETIVESYQDVAPSIALVNRPSPPSPPQSTTTVIQEVIKEVIKEIEPSNPGWLQARLEGLVERETKISDREKEVGKREEAIGRRESDATKREGWITEQLQGLNNEVPEEEYVYDHEHPRHYYGEARRSPPKGLPAASTVVITETETKFLNPPPAPTRVAARPTPETFVRTATAAGSGKTQEIFLEVPTVYVELPQETTTVIETLKHGKAKRRRWW